jgi:carbonic anhydrase
MGPDATYDVYFMFDELLSANSTYADGFALAGIAPVALVTCMDSRIEPLTMLGLHPGDAKILRNAGARVTPDVLRSLVLATRFLDVREIAVMQHTNCALADVSDTVVRTRLAAQGTEGVERWEFLAMPDPDAALAADVDLLRRCGQLPDGVVVEGWRYDVGTGGIHRIVPS